MPAQLQVFGDTFGTGSNGWQGNICGDFKVTENSPAAGSKMPPGGSLSGADMNNIQMWINDGAAP